MTAFDTNSSKQAFDHQRQKYPDLSEEMRRRAALRKVHSGGRGTTEQYKQRAKLGWEKRRAKANQAPDGQD